MKSALLLLALAAPAAADPFAVHDTATRLFERLPEVERVAQINGVCGADAETHSAIAYCTSQNLIFVSDGFESRPQAAYEMAHVLGHAIQVRHGVADVALREITRRRDEEAKLRGMVTRQVECVAGVLLARAEEPLADVPNLYEDEPFTGSHWGRDPLRIGPQVSIGIAARDEWLRIGYEASDFSVCSVGEMSADLILEAETR